ncbi:MAG: hypothetical protein RR939_08965 [Acinetobacter sp.]
MTNIAQVAVGVINLIDDARFIYSIAANAMDAVEAQNSGLSGADKKAWVMSFVKSVVFNIIENWDTYEALISDFIDKIKTAYNEVRSLFGG